MCFKYINKPSSYTPNFGLTIHLTGISTKAHLFEQLNVKLKFPEYFGHNWDALYDCLKDFHWIEQKDILIVHDEVPQIDYESFISYVLMLHDAIQDWEKDDLHKLFIVFPVECESEIEGILKNSAF